MDKLTKIIDGIATTRAGVVSSDILKKLAIIERDEENGRLFRLPKIGDKFYTLDGWRITESNAAYIVINADGVIIYDFRLIGHILGKNCFITKHEARRAAKKINGAI